MSLLVKRHELYKISPNPSLPKRGRSSLLFAKGGKILNSPFEKGGLRGIFNSKGFSLIELVMVITLIGIIAGVIAMPLMEGTKGWFQATTREGITESGRIAIERMMREIRNTARKANNTANCISVADAMSISFSDFSGNLTTCDSITFTLAAPNITRTDASGTSNLVNDITSLDINYYTRTNGVMTRPVTFPNTTSIRRVSIEIESTKGGETTRKYSEVYLPNAKGY